MTRDGVESRRDVSETLPVPPTHKGTTSVSTAARTSGFSPSAGDHVHGRTQEALEVLPESAEPEEACAGGQVQQEVDVAAGTVVELVKSSV